MRTNEGQFISEGKTHVVTHTDTNRHDTGNCSRCMFELFLNDTQV